VSKRLFIWSLTSALAGFLFGFDTVVISGAEKTIQELWGLDSTLHGLAISAALWGTVLGSLIGGWPTERIGRKKTLLSVGLLYFVSAVGSAFAPEIYSFMIARFIGGLGVGISTVAAPLYIAEIAPAKYRGRLAGMFQFNIVFGILIAFVSNAALGGIGENAWRWMLGVEAFPALIYTFLCFGIPESPRWLIAHSGQREAGIDVFRRIDPDMPEAELEATADKIAAGAKDKEAAARFWTARLRTPITLAFLIAFFNQLSGINAILYFAPRIFSLTGLDKSAALLQSVGIGFTNLVFTFIGLYLIDRLGRRTLLYIGSFGYIASLGLCAVAFFTYAPQFDVAAKAIAVKGLCKDEADFAKAKAALIKASSSEEYAGEAVTIAPDMAPDAVREIANKALEDASEDARASADVASKAIALKEACEKIESNMARNEKDKADLAEKYTNAKTALVTASSREEYEGEAVTIASDTKPAAVEEIADGTLQDASRLIGSGRTIVLVCIFAFIAAHAVGQGAVIWVFIGEIFPNRNRASGQALGSFTHWIFAALLTLFFPKMIEVFAPGYVFGLFCFMMVLQLIWVKLMVPETKGVPLEEIEKKLGIE